MMRNLPYFLSIYKLPPPSYKLPPPSTPSTLCGGLILPSGGGLARGLVTFSLSSGGRVPTLRRLRVLDMVPDVHQI